MKKKLKWMTVFAALLFAGLQFVGARGTNPPFDANQTLAAATEVPLEISEIFARSCNDCHSNQTDWRWYTRVAPVSWFTVGHVTEGRAELNFSEWGKYGTRMKQTRLKAICSLVESKAMPLESYVWAHPTARLSPAEIEKICAWSSAESEKIAAVSEK